MANPVRSKTTTVVAQSAHTDAELSAMAKDDVRLYLSILHSELSAGNLARAIDAAQHVNEFETIEPLLIAFLDHPSLSVREAAVLALVRSTSSDVQARLQSSIASGTEPDVLRVVAKDVLAEIEEG